MSTESTTKNSKFQTSDDEFHDACAKMTSNEACVDEILSRHANELSIEERNGVESTSTEIPIPHDFDKEKDENDVFLEDELLDEEALKEMEKNMTEEAIASNKEKAEQLKLDANILFKIEDYEKCISLYTRALKLAPTCYPNERAILYANRAAAKIKINSPKAAICDCNEAITLNPNYTKAILRRAKLYESEEKYDESLEDFKKVVQLEPYCSEAIAACHRLPPIIEERNEKLKTEMMGKLKDIGNMILKPFGLSTNNFQMKQDPGTGSYSINFKN